MYKVTYFSMGTKDSPTGDYARVKKKHLDPPLLFFAPCAKKIAFIYKNSEGKKYAMHAHRIFLSKKAYNKYLKAIEKNNYPPHMSPAPRSMIVEEPYLLKYDIKRTIIRPDSKSTRQLPIYIYHTEDTNPHAYRDAIEKIKKYFIKSHVVSFIYPKERELILIARAKRSAGGHIYRIAKIPTYANTISIIQAFEFDKTYDPEEISMVHYLPILCYKYKFAQTPAVLMKIAKKEGEKIIKNKET